MAACEYAFAILALHGVRADPVSRRAHALAEQLAQAYDSECPDAVVQHWAVRACIQEVTVLPETVA